MWSNWYPSLTPTQDLAPKIESRQSLKGRKRQNKVSANTHRSKIICESLWKKPWKWSKESTKALYSGTIWCNSILRGEKLILEPICHLRLPAKNLKAAGMIRMSTQAQVACMGLCYGFGWVKPKTAHTAPYESVSQSRSSKGSLNPSKSASPESVVQS